MTLNVANSVGIPQHHGEQDPNTAIWLHERPVGYDQLQWVHAEGLLYPFTVLTEAGTGTYVDMGTGTGAVLDKLGPYHDRAIGVDVSARMLEQVPRRDGDNVSLVLADAVDGMPFRDATVDLVTQRMMLHDLHDAKTPLREAWRILKTGGLLVACEYVTDIPNDTAIAEYDAFRAGESPNPPVLDPSEFHEADKDTLDLIQYMCALKHEPDRYLWSGQDLQDLLTTTTETEGSVQRVQTIEKWSVANWLEKSGFPVEECKQLGLLACIKANPDLKQHFRVGVQLDGVEVPPEEHAKLALAYESATSEERETMGVDASFYATFSYVRLAKD